MTLRPCAECGREISDQAPTCPHCGAPQQKAEAATTAAAPSQPGTPRGKVLSLALIALLAVVGVYGVVTFASAPDEPSPPLPSPKWHIAQGEQSDDCTVLGDYCETVICVIRNIGDGAGVVRVKAVLVPARRDGRTLSDERMSRVEPGAEIRERFDFRAAEMGADYTGRCEAG
jgi:hypothetical protein